MADSRTTYIVNDVALFFVINLMQTIKVRCRAQDGDARDI